MITRRQASAGMLASATLAAAPGVAMSRADPPAVAAAAGDGGMPLIGQR